MSFKPIQRARITEQVAAAIREAILGGRFEAGDNLPGERDLAEQFGVNRSSIREAIQRLESWGLVAVRHGGGTRVVDLIASANLNLLPYLIAPSGQVDTKLLADLLDLRAMILDWVATRAATRAGPADLDALDALIASLERAGDVAERQARDFAFFEALVALTDNRVLALLTRALGRVYAQNRAVFERLYADPRFDVHAHREALAAMRGGDARAAGDAMRRQAEQLAAAVARWGEPDETTGDTP